MFSDLPKIVHIFFIFDLTKQWWLTIELKPGKECVFCSYGYIIISAFVHRWAGLARRCETLSAVSKYVKH